MKNSRITKTVLLTLLLLTPAALAQGSAFDIWYGDQQSFGAVGKPQRWVNLLGNVSDPDGVVSLSYALNGGPQMQLGIGPDTRRLQRPGDFNVNIDTALFQQGLNFVDLLAVDGLGNNATHTVDVTWTGGTVWPETFSIDWSTVTELQDVVQVVDGKWTFDANGVRPTELGYDRILAIGDISWDTYELTVPVTVWSIDPNGFQYPSIAPGLGIVLRWQGHYDWGSQLDGPWQPIIGWEPVGADVWFDWGQNGGELDMSGDQGLYAPDPTGFFFDPGVTYWFKFRVEAITPDTSFYSAKVWEDGAAEPNDWQMSGVDGPGDLTSGSILLLAHHVDATFGNITITPLANSNPAIISDILVMATEDSADITWTTSKPATSVIDYGKTLAYELGTVSDPNEVLAHHLTLTNLTANTSYQFEISGIDSDGLPISSGPLAFITNGPDESGVVSDDFSGPTLNPNVWTLVDPLGDVTTELTGLQLALSVPEGVDHDIWTTGILAPRVVQTVANANFEIEVKFDSVVSERYQAQGVVIEESLGGTLRIEYFSDGMDTFAFAAWIDGGTADTLIFQAISGDGRQPLRVSRFGDAFTVLAELQPGVWSNLGQFTQPMTVATVGAYAANISDGVTPAPAHTALLDYFFNTSDPIVPEDGGRVSLSVVTSGNGSVVVDPNQDTYFVDDVVQLTAIPDAGWEFSGWSGDIVDANNPITITLSGDTAITANFDFVSDQTPPVISNVVITPGSNSAVITWTTDEPASSDYRYGLTGAYELGGVDDPTLTTEHTIAIAGLSTETTYFFVIASNDASANNSTHEDSFTTLAPQPSTIVSDDFHGAVLDPNVWTAVDPLGDATFTMTGTRLVIDVPGDIEHSAWVSGAFGPRVMQAANDVDFQVHAKFDSLPQQAYQVQGILIQQDATHFIRVSTHSDGNAIWLFVGTINGGSAQVRSSTTIPLTAPQYLRVTRTGSQWQIAYSGDGVIWTTTATFNHTMAVTAVGPFVGNEAGAQGTPAFTGIVDYFFNSESPVVPEDDGEWSLTVDSVGGGSVARDPNGLSHPDGSIVQLTAVPDPDWRFVRWTGGVASTDNPLDITLTDETAVTAIFESDTDLTPPVIAGVQFTVTQTSADITWTTDEPATTELRYGLTPSVELDRVLDPNLVTAHSVTLEGLVPDTEYFFELRAEDAAGNPAVAAVQSFTTDAVPQPSTLRSDNFSSPTLDPNTWEFVDPIGDATLTMTGTHAEIDVPGGIDHDLWTDGKFAPRLMQTCSDTDFAIEAKYDSVVAERYQLQGFLIEQDPTHFMRLDVHHDGTRARVFAATIVNSVPTVQVLQTLASGTPPYLRVLRSGDDWTYRYSYDGAAWTTAAQFNFPIAVSAVGVMIGNSSAGGAPPAFLGRIDYFQNLDAPVGADPSYTLSVQTTGNGAVVKTPDEPLYLSGSTVALEAIPDPGWRFAGWFGDISSTATPLLLTMTQNYALEARFVRGPPRNDRTFDNNPSNIGP